MWKSKWGGGSKRLVKLSLAGVLSASSSRTRPPISHFSLGRYVLRSAAETKRGGERWPSGALNPVARFKQSERGV